MPKYQQTYCSQCGREFGPADEGYSHCQDHDFRWRDFELLTTAQQAEAISLRPKWSAEEFIRFKFWVKADGHVSRRAGHHQLTRTAGAAIDAMLSGKSVRSKGDLAGFKSAVFHLAPERKP
jgi:hypothetical protein